ncbi:MAG: KxYKxGKxW signal peptide domain-containing protein [Streptococcaceae bacterium]|nr:KxYKxGKxW signal peptide domain-containing protein [Streptococcaceae bacterium]
MREDKQRKKLRKVKKVWVVAAVTFSSVITLDVAFANHPVLAFLSKASNSVVSTVSDVLTGSLVRENDEVVSSSSSADLPLFSDSSVLGSSPLSLGELPLASLGGGLRTC